MPHPDGPAASGSRLVGHSSSERTLDARDLASLRPARANAPRKKAKPVLREVTSGIVCFCGERFGESQALEFMLHLRAEIGEDLELLDRRRVAERQKYRRQREARPEFLMRRNQRAQERRHENDHPCECGCGQTVRASARFAPGHRRRVIPACGTLAGVSRHRRRGEKPCPECRAAKNADDRRRSKAKREGMEARSGKSPRPLSPDEIIRLYRDERLSIDRIAAMMHVQHQRISQELRKAGVPIRGPGSIRRALYSDGRPR